MKTLKFFIFALAAVSFVACGGAGSSSNADCAEKVECASKNCEDKLLDRFEKVVDEYSGVATQIADLAKAGKHAQIVVLADRQAELIEEFESVLQKVNEFYEAGRFSEEQKARGEKIGEKFAAALGAAIQ